MKNKITILLYAIFIIGYSSNTAYCTEKENYIITKTNDTLYFDKIEIKYFKRAVCYKSNGKKARYSAKKLTSVFTDNDTYESGRITPLVVGAKKYMLLYRYPEEVENQTIILYSYAGAGGGTMTTNINAPGGNSSGGLVTTYAIRNKNNKRGKFSKLSVNVRNKILAACPNCTQECIDIIMKTKIEKTGDVYNKIIKMVNQKCSD